jgi:hypothetical protein
LVSVAPLSGSAAGAGAQSQLPLQSAALHEKSHATVPGDVP